MVEFDGCSGMYCPASERIQVVARRRPGGCCEPPGRGFAVGIADRYSSVISTRRFFARPSFVLLLATGFALPQPLVVIRDAWMPRSTI